MTNTLLFKILTYLVLFILIFNLFSFVFTSGTTHLSFTYVLEKFSSYNQSKLIDFNYVFRGLDEALEKIQIIPNTDNKVIVLLTDYVNSFSNFIFGSVTFICYGAIMLYSLVSFGYFLWSTFV